MKLRFCHFIFPSILLLFSMFLVVSCHKENSLNGTDAQQEEASMASSQAEAEAEGVFNNLFDDVMGANDDVGISGTGVFYGRVDTLTPVPRCFTVTITHPGNTFFPVVIVVDFGNTGCTGPDGHVRSGKIITEYTARLIMPGAMATTSFDGYFVDDIKVEGTHKITNTSTPNTIPVSRKFKVEVIDAKLSKPNGNYTKWNSTKIISQIEGMATAIPRDDVLQIEGNSSGQVLRGNLLVSWESSITEPLIKRFTCRWIVKGRIRTARLNSSTNSPWIAILDFGNGDCDNQAVISINGISHQITLP